MTKHRLLAVFILLCSLLTGCSGIPAAQTEVPIKTYPPHFRPISTSTQQAVQKATASIGTPVMIQIPAIGVNAPIESVGILPNGNLATPQNDPWDGAGWYKFGPHPGEQGSAVIDAHVDRPGGGPATFWYLHLLKPGEQVIITTNTLQQLHFRVKQAVNYAIQDVPLQDIFADTSGKYLNLITCAGYYIPALHGTTLRTVVFTVLQ